MDRTACILVTPVITLVLDYDPRGREMQKHYAVDMGVIIFSTLVFAKMEAVELRPLPRDSMSLNENLHYVFPSCVRHDQFLVTFLSPLGELLVPVGGTL